MHGLANIDINITRQSQPIKVMIRFHELSGRTSRRNISIKPTQKRVTAVDAGQDAVVKLEVVHPMCMGGYPEQSIPILKILVKTAQRDPVPTRSQNLREPSGVHDFVRVRLPLGYSIGKGPNPRFVLNTPVEQPRVVTAAGGNDDFALDRPFPSPHSFFNQVNEVTFG